jgi:hypothetical protein
MNNTIKAYVILDAISDIEHVLVLLQIDGKADSYECKKLRNAKAALLSAIGYVDVTVEKAA